MHPFYEGRRCSASKGFDNMVRPNAVLQRAAGVGRLIRLAGCEADVVFTRLEKFLKFRVIQVGVDVANFIGCRHAAFARVEEECNLIAFRILELLVKPVQFDARIR